MPTTIYNPTKRAAALFLLTRGMATLSEVATLAGVSRQLVRHWAMHDDIDAAATRAAYLRRAWERQAR